ncbi:hypothetical protein H310_07911 [Aphanomyces invadans]|uniref:S phase cyclin A-associated protein in the endoplasmic reticulum N-terminal domain-containing protein n=1 Tax=Aphanomyces invadans TaxID=157072 RepID=A0A024U1W8_9STRA|nr:hypothetical protein H310_07911 [Aphanomyces invadans]ETV99876.1 hypothetical protein H310_07911 [Aphanomyces invadans]|eukprot:XP_008871652.1 hypothetical protein H310_07911 [Aphanomyces invadans]
MRTSVAKQQHAVTSPTDGTSDTNDEDMNSAPKTYPDLIDNDEGRTHDNDPHHDRRIDDEQVSFKMRLWDYLLRNVHSAVDELYCMCELESSMSRCEDAARVVQSCHDDFIKLMECIRMQSSVSSKSSLAWEVKKGHRSHVVKPTNVVVQALERIAKTKSPPPHDRSLLDSPIHSTGKQNVPRAASCPSPSILAAANSDASTQQLTPRHQKLSLPRKPKRSPSETKLLSEQRLDTVTANKHAIESARLSRIRLAAERMQHVTSRNASSRQKQEDMMWAKLARADRLKQAHLRWIVSKAGSENTKVDEINFIQTLMHQDRKMELQQRLDHVAVRRANLLRQIQDKAMLKAESIRAAAKAKEEKLELRVSQIQKRHEGVQARRLQYQQEKKGVVASLPTELLGATPAAPPSASKRKARQQSQPRQQSATSHHHHHHPTHAANQVDGVQPSLEGSVERTMALNAQRLRDRMRSLTKSTSSIQPSKAPSPPASPRTNLASPPPLQHVQNVMATAVQEKNDAMLHSALLSLLHQHQPAPPSPPLLSPTSHHVSASCSWATSPHTLAMVATVPTLRWVSKPTIALALRVLFGLCASHRHHIDTLLGSNLVLPLVDVLVWALQHWDRNDVLRWAMPLLALCLGPTSSSKLDTMREDVGRYIANVGILFRVADRFALVAVTQQDDLFRLTCHFLIALTRQCHPKRHVVARTMQDLRVPVAKIFKTTGLFGMIPLLLASVPIHEFEQLAPSDDSNASNGGNNATEAQSFARKNSSCVVALSGLILRALTNIARLDVTWFQAVVGSSSNHPRFLELVRSVLLSACHELLVELLPLLGYFALQCRAHQKLVREDAPSGDPSVLQLLAATPFPFYSDSRGKDVLFPTLLICCWGDDDNSAILEMDVNPIMLVVYLQKQIEQQRAASTATSSSMSSGESWRGLAARLPLDSWDDVLRYFEGRSGGTRPPCKQRHAAP